MRASHLLLAAAISAVAATSVMAQPAIVSLGTGSPASVTRPISGVYYVGGSGASGTQAARWAFNGTSLSVIQAGGSGGGFISKDNGQYIATGFLNGPTRFAVGNTATGVVPAFLSSPTLVASATQPAATEFGGGRWDASTGTITGMGAVPVIPFTPNPTPTIDIGTSGVYGSSSGGSTTGNFITPNAISANGRYIVALAYVCVYNTAGTSISANSFYWRPVIWDAQGNGGAGKLDVLPTPFRTSTSTGANTRRRTGNPYAVSNDGQVIVGATEHNVGTTPGPDVDGGRLVVWRWNSSTNSYGMTYLDTGVDTNGFPKYISSTPSGVTMNTTGTIIAARGPDGITKWVWDGNTNSWGAPIIIGSNLSTPASWLPASVTGCGVPPNIGGSLAMSDDGNIIAGSAVYSTCGSFMSGGFIWHNSDGQIKDWYDYLKSLGTPGVDSGMIYGPIGDNGDPSRGLPALGFPTAISPDGNAVTSIQSGTQRIPGAVPTLVVLSGGSSCLPPSIALEPNASNLFSACTSSIILNTSAAGSGPFTYQWYKDGNPLSEGLTPSGATIVGATSFQFRLNAPIGASDAGNYYCVVTGQCGTPAQTINASVAVDPAFPAALNDVCSTAIAVNAGTNVLSPAQSPCAAYIYDNTASYSCGTAPPKNDLWYVFTPATSGNYRFDTCGANFDTHLGLFADCNGNELACNNDYLVGPSTGCTSNRSRIGSYTLAAGIPVYIRVAANNGAFLSATSTINLSITTAPAAVSNDLCDNAATAVIGANALDTTEANGEFTASCAATVGNTRDVWFKYTPASDGLLTAATCPGTTWNTVLGIYTDCFGSEIACNDNAGLSGCSSQSSIADLQVTAGTTYFFRVGGNSLSAFGAGSLTLSFTPQGACCTGNICSVTTAALCATSGGTYKGNGVACGDQTCTSQCALADFNHVGGVTADDIFAFLDAWFAQNGQTGSGLTADVNASNSVTADDIFAFLDLWFTYNGQTCP